jgi:hypothetical protein
LKTIPELLVFIHEFQGLSCLIAKQYGERSLLVFVWNGTGIAFCPYNDETKQILCYDDSLCDDEDDDEFSHDNVVVMGAGRPGARVVCRLCIKDFSSDPFVTLRSSGFEAKVPGRKIGAERVLARFVLRLGKTAHRVPGKAGPRLARHESFNHQV